MITSENSASPETVELYGFGALLEIALHQYRTPGSRFAIYEGRLFTQDRKKHDWGWGVNTLGTYRFIWGQNKNDMHIVTRELKKIIRYSSQDEDLRKLMATFFREVFLPSLKSLKTMYAGTAAADSVSLWKTKIRNFLELEVPMSSKNSKKLDAKAAQIERNIHHLVNCEKLQGIIEIFQKNSSFTDNDGKHIRTEKELIEWKVSKITETHNKLHTGYLACRTGGCADSSASQLLGSNHK